MHGVGIRLAAIKNSTKFSLKILTTDSCGYVPSVKSRYLEKIHGYDERFFMYLEDVDICKRMNSNNKAVLYDNSQSVVHDARRQTFRGFRHSLRHLRSMVRFFLNI